VDVKQEYPCNHNEAFLTTGDTVFNIGIVSSLNKMEYVEDSKYS